MTKSSVDRKRSKYGEKYTLRFHKKTKTYELSTPETPMLIAKFVETDGDLAMRLFELLEGNYKERELLFDENNVLNDENKELKKFKDFVRTVLVSYLENKNLTAKQNQILIEVMKKLEVV